MKSHTLLRLSEGWGGWRLPWGLSPLQWPWGGAFSGRGPRVRALEVGQGEVVGVRLSQQEEGCEVMEGPV